MLTSRRDESRLGGDELFVADLTTGVDELLQGVAVVPLVDIHRSGHGAIPEPERGELPGRQIAPHHEPILRRVGEPAILTSKVVLIGEEEWPQLVRSLGAQQIARDMQALDLGISPVLHPDPVPILRMIMGRDIAGGIDVGIGAAQVASTAIPPSASLRPAASARAMFGAAPTPINTVSAGME